jgi:hypothetical protein
MAFSLLPCGSGPTTILCALWYAVGGEFVGPASAQRQHHAAHPTVSRTASALKEGTSQIEAACLTALSTP